MADTIEQIECPACGKIMHKIFIEGNGLALDICTEGCGGMFFDNQEIREFSDYDADLSQIKDAFENKNFAIVDENKTRICPACKAKMIKKKP